MPTEVEEKARKPKPSRKSARERPRVVNLTWPVERQAVAGDISQIARYLQNHLGQRMTAYLSGVKDPKMVGQWASGKVRPRPVPSYRLRSAYQAARYLVDAYDGETARAWFFGMNPRLDDEAPAYVLRHGSTPEDWRFVIAAAKEFVETAS